MCYRVVGLVDAAEEEELSEEEGGHQVPVDGVEVGEQPGQEEEEEEGDEEGDQRRRQSRVGHDLQGQDLAVLRGRST